MNKIISFMLIFAITLSTTSCYDKIELEDRDLVLTAGIDKYVEDEETTESNSEETEEESSESGEKQPLTLQSRENVIAESLENNRFTVTLSVPNPYDVINDQDDPDRIVFSNAETVTGAVDKINKNYGTKLDFAQTKVIILGRSLLEDPELLKQTIDALERNKRLSRKVLVLATEHDAKEVMNSEFKDIKILGYFLSNYYANNKTGNIHSSNQGLISLIQSLEKTKNAIIPLISIYDKEIDLSNALIVKNLKWEEVAFEEDLRGYLIMINDKNTPILITTQFEDFFVPLRSTKRKIDTFITKENDTLYYNINMQVEGSINEFSFDEQSLLKNDSIQKLEESYNSSIELEILNSFYFFQDKVGVDGFNILDEFYKNNYELYNQYENMDKEEILKLFKPKINITTKINSIGTTN